MEVSVSMALENQGKSCGVPAQGDGKRDKKYRGNCKGEIWARPARSGWLVLRQYNTHNTIIHMGVVYFTCVFARADYCLSKMPSGIYRFQRLSEG